MMKMLLATRNKGKIQELAVMLAEIGIELVGLDRFENIGNAIEDGTTFAENALKKAFFGMQATGLWTLADDSGLSVVALDGAPGVYSARYASNEATDAENNAKLLENMRGKEDRCAKFVCTLALVSPQGEQWLFDGECPGKILEKEQGNGGFGYDPLFWCDQLGKSLGDATMEEKNLVSHRGAAVGKLLDFLRLYRGEQSCDLQ